MKKFLFAAMIACLGLFASCDQLGVEHQPFFAGEAAQREGDGFPGYDVRFRSGLGRGVHPEIEFQVVALSVKIDLTLRDFQAVALLDKRQYTFLPFIILLVLVMAGHADGALDITARVKQ